MMPEDDKDKAEKLAAAKKRFEQLKKQKAKEGGSGGAATADGAKKKKGAKKKDVVKEKKEDEVEAEEGKDGEPAGEEKAADAAAPVDTDAATTDAAAADDEPAHARAPSISQQSRLRSTSFRAGIVLPNPGGPTSPPLKSPLSPTADAADVFRKQAARLDELERENKTLSGARDEAEARWRRLETEVQELREAASEGHAAGGNAAETDALRAELEAAERQVALLGKERKASAKAESADADSTALQAEVASKAATIDALEVDLSSLNAKLATLQTSHDTQTSALADLEAQLETQRDTASSAQQELADLKANLAQPSDSDADTQNATIATLEAELSASRREATAASSRATKAEAKLATLDKLHRDAATKSPPAGTAASSDHDKEIRDLRARLAALHTENDRLRDSATRHSRLSAEGDAAGLEELEDEERARLQRRVRELEDEVFELRRGVWRDLRAQMQPGLEGDDSAAAAAAGEGFDDVDLSAGLGAPRGGPTSPAATRQTSSFADVIQSGISAFSSAPHAPAGRRSTRGASITSAAGAGAHPGGLAARPRKQSLGLLGDEDEDFAFDEESFRQAQAEEARARVERVKEVKRGLGKWKGWRVDLADVRAGMGGVFEV